MSGNAHEMCMGEFERAAKRARAGCAPPFAEEFPFAQQEKRARAPYGEMNLLHGKEAVGHDAMHAAGVTDEGPMPVPESYFRGMNGFDEVRMLRRAPACAGAARRLVALARVKGADAPAAPRAARPARVTARS